MKKIISAGTVCVFIGILLVGGISSGCGQESTPTGTAAPDVIDLTLGNQHPMQAAMNYAVMVSWGEYLERESNGRLTLTILPSAQAAATSDLFDAAKTGIIDIGCQQFGEAPGRFPLNEICYLPNLFQWPNSYTAAMTNHALVKKYPEMMDEFAGTKYLLIHSTSADQMCTIKKPLHGLDDLQGMLICTIGTYGQATDRALGAEPTFVDRAERYDAAAKGVFDGATSNVEALWVFGEKDIYNHVLFMNIQAAPFVHIMNQDTYDNLPADLKPLFSDEEMTRLVEMFGHQFDEDEQKYLVEINKIFTEERGLEPVQYMSDADQARYEELIKPVYQMYVDNANKLGAPGEQILADAIAFGKEFAYTGFKQDVEDMMHEWGAEGH